MACIRLRDAPLAALVRLEPELADAPVAVVSNAGTAGFVLACTAHARAGGVAPGQTAHQARAVLPGLRVRAMDEGAIGAARAALADAAAAIAPRVEPDGDRVYLDVGEVRGMYPSEPGIVAAITAAAARVGLAVDVGIAGNKGVARVAASRRVGGAVVPAGGERAAREAGQERVAQAPEHKPQRLDVEDLPLELQGLFEARGQRARKQRCRIHPAGQLAEPRALLAEARAQGLEG